MSKPQTSETKSLSRSVYPFSAIVGQTEMKLALILNVIDPIIGGVLIMGHRGTAKSTAVRGLADLLPRITVVKGCAYRCDPDEVETLCESCRVQRRTNQLSKEKVGVTVVELPLGATEDRVCGSIDIERALKDATKSFEPGLLARANRGFLYIDEVNLLSDHLVDLLLDVAATGHHRVEREGISGEHPARFVLIGSGNPEEGELRPQLLDRFGLQVQVTTENDPAQRVEIIERRENFEADRELFLSQFESEQLQLRKSIVRAQRNLASVKVARELLIKIAELCSALNLDGHRGELTITRASRALAAFENRKHVKEDDVKRVAGMALRHRLRSGPFEEVGGNERIKEALEKTFGETQQTHSQRRSQDGSDSNNSRAKIASASAASRGSSSRSEFRLRHLKNDVPAVPELENHFFDQNRGSKSTKTVRERRHSRSKTIEDDRRGRYTRATEKCTDGARVAVDATLRAAAAAGVKTLDGPSKLPLRFKQFSRKSGSLYIFAIDTSGSMAPRRIERAREGVISLLQRSYMNRDDVAIIAFRGTEAQIVLPPCRSILRAKRALDSMTIGGGTPLSAGLMCAMNLADKARMKHGCASIFLFTDGHANVPLRSSAQMDRSFRRGLIENELEILRGMLSKADANIVVVNTQPKFLSSTGPEWIARVLSAPLVQL